MPMNFARTGLLLAIMAGLFTALGGLIGGQTGLLAALILSAALNGFAYWKSDQIVLRMQNAHEVNAVTGGQLHAMVAELARRAELPMPKVYLTIAAQPNAFATGRSPERGAVCASTGLLDLLSPEEVAGVMAHELAHIKNRDTLTMTVAATLAGAISMIAQWLQFSAIFGGRPSTDRHGRLATLAAVLLAPFAAMLVQTAISRSREYQADRLGGMICGNPLWLASALARIEEHVRRIPNPAVAEVPALAHLFIINPLAGGGMDNLFLTHPRTENRIAELKKLAAEMGIQAMADGAERPRPSILQPRRTWR